MPLIGGSKCGFKLAATAVVFALLCAALEVFFLRGDFSRNSGQAPADAPASKRTIYYSLTVRNKSGSVVTDSVIDVLAPVKRSAWHSAGPIKASHGFELLSDQIGNQTLRFVLTLAPYATKIISIEAEISYSKDYSAPKEGEWSEAPNLASIQDLAKDLRAETPYQSAEQAVRWIEANMEDSGFSREDRGAEYALTKRRGDCTEYAELFVVLARSMGIPARVMGGFRVLESGRIAGRSYHNWAEYFDGTGWEIADPYYGALASGQERYAALRIIPDSKSTQGERSHSQRFLSFDPKLEIALN